MITAEAVQQQALSELERFTERVAGTMPAEVLPIARGAFVMGMSSGAKLQAVNAINQFTPTLDGIGLVALNFKVDAK